MEHFSGEDSVSPTNKLDDGTDQPRNPRSPQEKEPQRDRGKSQHIYFSV